MKEATFWLNLHCPKNNRISALKQKLSRLHADTTVYIQDVCFLGHKYVQYMCPNNGHIVPLAPAMTDSVLMYWWFGLFLGQCVEVLYMMTIWPCRLAVSFFCMIFAKIWRQPICAWKLYVYTKYRLPTPLMLRVQYVLNVILWNPMVYNHPSFPELMAWCLYSMV